MIEIEQRMVDGVRRASDPRDLHEFLQNALRLEHATVPLYLTAFFSLRPGSNPHVAAALRSVVLEEMLHFAIVANVLNAVGGRPMIDDGRFVPTFPGALPMGVAEGLSVCLRAMSIEQCRVFMTIEEPDDPIARAAGPDTTTIGDFYQAIMDKLRELGEGAFAQPTAPQVVSPWFPPDQLFAITNVDTAVRALSVIVQQGEGTTSSPGDGDDGYAHYYRFAEIVHRKRLIPDATAEEGFSYSGPAVEFDATAVLPMNDQPGVALYQQQSTEHRLATQFCACYRRLLACLQATFSGTPETLNAAMGLMYELRLAALAMLAMPDPAQPGARLTPSWEYL